MTSRRPLVVLLLGLLCSGLAAAQAPAGLSQQTDSHDRAAGGRQRGGQRGPHPGPEDGTEHGAGAS